MFFLHDAFYIRVRQITTQFILHTMIYILPKVKKELKIEKNMDEGQTLSIQATRGCEPKDQGAYEIFGAIIVIDMSIEG